MRLFIAVNFDSAVKSRLLSLRDRIREQSTRGNFSRPENLHLTLVFIGETKPALVPALKPLMEKAVPPSMRPFALDFEHTGCFTHSGKELWWIGAQGGAGSSLGQLLELRRRLTDGLTEAGIPFDSRPFRAHITLGREIKHTAPIELPAEKMTVPVNRVSLMQSQHINGLLAYTEIAACPLVG